MIKVKAAVPEGEAYQVFISKSNVNNIRRFMTGNAPKWFIDLINDNEKGSGGMYFRSYLVVADENSYSEAYNGDWIVRGPDGKMIVLTNQMFSYLYGYA